MARDQFYNVALDSSGKPVTTARCTVYVAVPYAGTPLTTAATIYSGESGAGTPGNPFDSATGDISFWADSGSYDVQIVDTGSPKKFADKVVRWNSIPGDKGLRTEMLADSGVTNAKVASNAIAQANVADAAIGGAEIVDHSITSTEIDEATAGMLSISTATARRGKCIILGAETRTNVALGLMPTPDRVQSIVLPTDGLILVLYQAIMQSTAGNAGRANIFLGASAIGVAGSGSAAAFAVVAATATANVDSPLATTSYGLATGGNTTSNYTGDLTTGQAIGATGAGSGGPCYIFAAAGTYDVSIQFQALSGSVTVKNRRLWVWAIGF